MRMSDKTSSWRIQEEFLTDPEPGRRVIEQVVAELRQRKWEERDVFAVQLAMDEALINAVKHGNRLDAEKTIRIACTVSEKRVVVEVTDEGPGFDPDAVPDPTDPERLELPTGRGIMLMRNFMTRVEYKDAGNRVVMEKLREAV